MRVHCHAYLRLRAGSACVCVRAPSPFSALTAPPRRSNNKIGDDGAAALASSLEGLTALNMLYL
jgi:hypothetical protein